MHRPRSLLRRVAAVAGALALTATLAPATAATAAPPTGKGTPLTVMSRNVYLGGDITRPLRPAPPGVPSLIALANQNHELRRVVGLTDFPARARLLAREIATTQPDAIGLQEVATWRTGPLELDPATDAPTFAMLQARELVATQVRTTDRTVVLMCDCNSDPLDTSTKPGEPIPGIAHRDPYLFLTSVLDDAWLRSGTADPGFTSGLDEQVSEPAPASFTHRIDLVLTRGAGGATVPVDRAVVVGADPANRTATGLWPSDHAGVVVRLRP